jgi:tRNA G18 (ribose-2'-O)-methylase SpoU
MVDRKMLPAYEQRIGEGVDILVVEHAQVEELIGYNFHRGILACGIRKPRLVLRNQFAIPANERETVAAVIGVQDPENVGGILRSCAGLGVQRVILGPGTADPLSRRVLRVSMGMVLELQIFHSSQFLSDLRWLQSEMNIELIATSLESSSTPLETATRDKPAVILVGNEREGLPSELQAICDRKLRIAMELGADSLNVSVAAGIVLHYFCRLAG